tara:strand:+ start:294 stop:578 length:285 start_codon:yes stop_codon:yes gene_type:complete
MKDNKLIAEFMGLPTQVFKSGKLNYKRNDSWFEEHELSYNVSWDWLMPVLSKCFKTGDDTQEWDNIMDTLFTCDIDIVYAQIVEFIKEYNNDNR